MEIKERFTANIISLLKFAANGLKEGTLKSNTLLKIIAEQKKASRIRKRFHRSGTKIPQVMIASITKKCSMNCIGCYHKIQRKDTKEMDPDQWGKIFDRASQLGISIFVIAGGEPLERPNVMENLAAFDDKLVAVYTNLTPLNEMWLDFFHLNRHIIPIVSIEGYGEDTEFRRGKGLYDIIISNMEKLRNRNIFFGSSSTTWKENIDSVTDEFFINELIAAGAAFFSYIEYVPVDQALDLTPLDEEDVNDVQNRINLLQNRYNRPFFIFPGSDEQYGGCLAAGRGFFHVAPDGAMEPCPFAPMSDTSLKDTDLLDALTSPLFKEIREDHHNFSDKNGGCSLWKKAK